MSSRSRKPRKYRGPSRPVDPRYAPGLPQKRGPDTFGMVLIGVSTAAVLLVIIYIALFQQPTTTTTTTGTDGQPVSGAEATQQLIAYSTQVATLPRIEAAEAKALHEAGTATIIDVRPSAGYAAEHIVGATNIPYTDVQARVAEFPREGNVILYCQ
jgi:hypothetical protein